MLLLRTKLSRVRIDGYQEQKQKHTNSISVGGIKISSTYQIHTCIYRYMFIVSCICLLFDRCKFHLYSVYICIYLNLSMLVILNLYTWQWWTSPEPGETLSLCFCTHILRTSNCLYFGTHGINLCTFYGICESYHLWPEFRRYSLMGMHTTWNNIGIEYQTYWAYILRTYTYI